MGCEPAEFFEHQLAHPTVQISHKLCQPKSQGISYEGKESFEALKHNQDMA